MVIVPDTDIILIKSPLKLDNYNQMTFTNATAQYNYFSSLTKLEYDDCTYLRKDGVIRYATGDNLRYEDLLQYNYCMYKNDSYKDKWFYAFITDCTYINDGMTEIKIDTDCFQTWQFDITYMNSFIEREHVSDDTVGLHTIPEGLEHGDYIVNTSGDVETDLDSTPLIVIGVSKVPDNTPFYTSNRMYGNVYSGLTYILFKFTESASKFIQAYDDLGWSDNVISVFTMPLTVANVSYSDGWSTGNLGNQTGINFMVLPNQSYKEIRNNISLTSPTTLNGYTPKNNKLFTGEYNYLAINNNCGSQINYNYEDFVSNSPNFYLVSTITPSCSIMLYPSNYKKYNTITKSGYAFGLPVGKYPQGSWNSDQYTNWLTQNGINILGHKIDGPTAQAIGGSIEALLGAGRISNINPRTGQQELSGEGASSIASGLGKMFGAVQEMYRHSMLPNSIGGQLNSGDIQFAYRKMSPTYYKMSIKSEYASIIDSWFSMYGYKVNEVKTPNIHKRSNWDYIKTINVNLEGNIPEKDLEKIRNLFDNGCTFWHTTTYFLDYSKTNSIL